MRSIRLLSILVCLASCSNTNEVVLKNPAGQIIEKYFIDKDSLRHGENLAFFDNGSLKEKALYAQGVLDGQRQLFFPNGQTQIIENYVAGHMHGNYEVYYESGLLLLKQNFRMDTLEGISRKYYENGQLEEEVMFADNLENGPFKEYYENGLLHWEGQYLNGDNEFGLLKEYDDMGELIKKMMCDSLAICRTIWTLKEGDITPKY